MSKNENAQWFNDDRVELLYLVELVAELLQIIHRTALRKIKSNENINIYIAFEDIKNEDEDICRIFQMMRAYFTSGMKEMGKDARYTYLEVYNGSIYGRNKKIEKFASEIIKILEAHDVCEIKLSKKTLGEVGKELIQFFKDNDNWNNNKDAIIDRFEKNGLHLFVKSERVKVFSII